MSIDYTERNQEIWFTDEGQIVIIVDSTDYKIPVYLGSKDSQEPVAIRSELKSLGGWPVLLTQGDADGTDDEKKSFYELRHPRGPIRVSRTVPKDLAHLFFQEGDA